MSVNIPPIDSRCSDPAFSEKYPSACRFFSRLILKNERSKSLVAQLVPFKAFVMANGSEVELATVIVADPLCVPSVLLTDNFNTENGGTPATNYESYTNWDVSGVVIGLHSTDLVDSNLTLLQPGVLDGFGLAVDMLGTNKAGTTTLSSKTTFNFVAGTTYRLSFSMGGNNRRSDVTHTFSTVVGTLVDQTLNPAWNEVMTTRTYEFTPASNESAKIVFSVETLSLAFDYGPLLDNVLLEIICPDVSAGSSTSGVEFSSSDPAVATIDAVTGIATTIAVGKTTISGKWNNQYAYAELEVVEECDVEGNYLVLIDNSFSMQQNFDGVYPTKLSYAKYLADRFFSSMNTTKDQMAFGNFNVEADINVESSSVIATLNGAVQDVFTTPTQTDLAAAIEFGVEYLNAMDGLKVLVLVTDGQYNKGGLPGPIAREFRQSGGIIIVVGVRVFDVYFQLLNEISTKGYFLSAYGSIATAVGTNLIGLKSFLCSGDCPGGAVYGCLTEPLDTQIADPDPLQVQSEY